MCFKLMIKRILPTPKFTKYQKFLFIAAHTGDIAKSSGGTVNKLSKQQKEIKFIIATNSLSKLKKIEDESIVTDSLKKEEMASATLLGAREIEFLPFKDDFELNVTQLRDELIKVITDYQPDVIFIDDINTPNELLTADRVVAQATLEAVEILQSEYLSNKIKKDKIRLKAIVMYNTIRPNVRVGIFGCMSTKLNAIVVHASELPEDSEGRFSYTRAYKSLIRLSALKNGLFRGKIFAESFFVISPKSMHNMPDFL